MALCSWNPQAGWRGRSWTHVPGSDSPRPLERWRLRSAPIMGHPGLCNAAEGQGQGQKLGSLLGKLLESGCPKTTDLHESLREDPRKSSRREALTGRGFPCPLQGCPATAHSPPGSPASTSHASFPPNLLLIVLSVTRPFQPVRGPKLLFEFSMKIAHTLVVCTGPWAHSLVTSPGRSLCHSGFPDLKCSHLPAEFSTLNGAPLGS